MVGPIGLPRLAVGLAFIPFAALLAGACGGSDVVDSPDTGAGTHGPDASKDAPVDGTLPNDGAADSNPSDSNGADTNPNDTGGADADAGVFDAEAGLIDADAGAPDAEAGGSDTGAGDADAGIDAGVDAAIDAGVDAAIDAGVDAAIDAGADAGLDGGDGGIGPLGSAKKFAILAGSTITITPSPTTIVGDVGVSPGTSIVTLPPGQPVGNVHAGDPVAAQAQSDLTAAYNSLAGMQCLPANNMTGVDLGERRFHPAVYCFNSSAGITGNLVLDAQGNPNATWVIQVGSTLTTATGATVSVIGGGSACNVYWQIGSSATLGTGTSLVGSIVALTSISLVTGTTVPVGRLLARNGAVALDGNAISAGACQ